MSNVINFEREGLAIPSGPSYLVYGYKALLMAVRQADLLVPDAPAGRQAASLVPGSPGPGRQFPMVGRQAGKKAFYWYQALLPAGRQAFSMAGRQAGLLVPEALTDRQTVADDCSLHQTSCSSKYVL